MRLGTRLLQNTVTALISGSAQAHALFRTRGEEAALLHEDLLGVENRHFGKVAKFLNVLAYPHSATHRVHLSGTESCNGS
jgi:hypothetical protein